MANFRRSNQRNNRKAGSWLSRLILFTVFLVVAIIYLTFKANTWFQTGTLDGSPASPDGERFYLPSSTGQLVHHKFYSLDYNEKHEQANWVAYELTKASLKMPNVKRAKRFNPDYSVNSQSAFHKDYTHSGYTRGHMAPAGDMAFSEAAMKESFLMSNMSPQLREFNNGIWRELEENVRDWAYDDKRLYVISGPVLNTPIQKRIGKNKVSVPNDFFKILLDMEGGEQKAIAFLIPHAQSDKHLKEYAVTIDEIEKTTGIDFFGDLLEDWEEEQLESAFDVNKWKFDHKRFEDRVKHWNHQ